MKMPSRYGPGHFCFSYFWNLDPSCSRILVGHVWSGLMPKRGSFAIKIHQLPIYDKQSRAGSAIAPTISGSGCRRAWCTPTVKVDMLPQNRSVLLGLERSARSWFRVREPSHPTCYKHPRKEGRRERRKETNFKNGIRGGAKPLMVVKNTDSVSSSSSWHKMRCTEHRGA
ncbi:hypothetical protein VTI74DRAFT_4867 [Chaetomium olivicolor]